MSTDIAHDAMAIDQPCSEAPSATGHAQPADDTTNESTAILKEPNESADNETANKTESKAMPPPVSRMPPPVPKFKGPSDRPPSQPVNDAETAARSRARAAAVAAAAAAVKSALPAQRERAASEAAARAYAAQQAELVQLQPDQPDTRASRSNEYTNASADSDAVAAPEDQKVEAAGTEEAPQKAPVPREPGKYEPPPWSGVPQGVPYTVEEIKGGASLGERDIADKAFYTFGRTPNNDVMLEHPSSSRLHAVIQFSGETGKAFLYDANSAHGTFLNRRRLKPGVYVPLRVGDMVKFGQSTRDFVLGGPAELMPEEGLSKVQRHELRLMKAKQARKEREAAVGAAQMEVALGSGASWGFGEDAINEDEEGLAHVDWRAYSQTKGLTDKQDKVATKIRKKEATIRNLTTETERIRAKGANDELTAGQAATLARNERTIDVLKEELEDLEETLNDSVRDSIRGRKKSAEETSEAKKAAARRRKMREEDEDAGSSDEDEFYDRTRSSRAEATNSGADVPARKKAKKEEAEDAGSLFTRVEVLSADIARLQAAIRDESAKAEAKATAAAGDAAASAAAAQPDARNSTAAEQSGGEGSSDVAAASPAAEDALDAFMSTMAHQMEADKVTSLQQELASVQLRLEDAQKLLKIADPDGFYTAGSTAARQARAKAAAAAKLEAQRAEARERQRQAKLAEKLREAELAAQPMEEEEEDAAAAAAAAPSPVSPSAAASSALTPAAAAVAAPTPAAAEQAQVPAASPAGADAATAGSASDRSDADQQARRAPPSGPGAAAASSSRKQPASRPHAEAGTAQQAAQQQQQQRQQPEPGPATGKSGPRAGLELRGKRAAPAAVPVPLPTPGSGRLLSRAQLQAVQQDASRQAAEADSSAALNADLELLSRARRADLAKQAEEMEAWQPPTEQSGDGRTALNDKYGY